MHTTTYNFEQVWAYAKADVACTSCGAIASKNVREYCTVNPFNKDEEGNVRPRSEVRMQAQKNADAQAIRLMAEGRICAKCRVSQAPGYEHSDLTLDALEYAQEQEGVLTETLKAIQSQVRDQWVGRDVIYGGRLCVVRSISFSDDHFYVELGVYSKAKYAKPGEILGDYQYAWLKEIRLVEQAER